MDRLFAGFASSVAGMAAERKRMEVISANLANANTVGPNGPYVRKSVVFEEVLGKANSRFGGVQAVHVYDDTVSEHPRVLDPGHPYADKEGYVTRPNVQVMFEMVDLMMARRAYSANLAAFQSWRSMLRDAISSIGRR